MATRRHSRLQGLPSHPGHFTAWSGWTVRNTASIESAPLPAGLEAAVEASLTRRYGSALATAFAHRPSLIGGMRIQVGCDLYDGSVLAGLEALEKSF